MADERPTHRVKATGALVFPQGYDAADLERVPAAEYKAHQREQRALENRAARNVKLAASDHMMLPDRGLDEARLQRWIDYRQALRDMDVQGDPVWPDQPE